MPKKVVTRKRKYTPKTYKTYKPKTSYKVVRPYRRQGSLVNALDNIQGSGGYGFGNPPNAAHSLTTRAPITEWAKRGKSRKEWDPVPEITAMYKAGQRAHKYMSSKHVGEIAKTVGGHFVDYAAGKAMDYLPEAITYLGKLKQRTNNS